MREGEQQRLSNTQMKKQRMRQWRQKAKENDGSAPHAPEIQGSFRPVSLQPSSPLLSKQLAIDCEMVGAGPKGCRDMLARVSIVNSTGQVVYDNFVTPIEPVTDYRSFVSGVYPHHLRDYGLPFKQVQREVSTCLR